jgi:glycosyltransferase involved in cell wall biosynthesis
MTRRPLIDFFSPLPPVPTDIGNHTAGVLAELQHLARVRVWTSQQGEIALPLESAEVCRFSGESPPFHKLNEADATFYNLGNNATFHHDIHAVARRVPGVVILHDTGMQHFFAAYGERPESRAYYLDQLERAHGAETRALGEAHIAGRGGFEKLVEVAPMSLAALQGAIAGVLHNRGELDLLVPRTSVPLYYMPLSFRYGPAPQRRTRARGTSVRLVMFGFIGGNRRLDAVLEALASIPERAQYQLDIYGPLERPEAAQATIHRLGLSEIVRTHGFVPEQELDAALSRADLALNLRWPSMGEASGSQLRIWAAGLAAVVTRVGWYAQLPTDCVFMIDHAREREELVRHLQAVRLNPEPYERAGQRGRSALERDHSPCRYAQSLVEIAADHSAQHARWFAAGLIERAARAALELGTHELARSLAQDVGLRIADLTGR